ncbi:hypothetical protein ABVC38_00215 [Lactobacillus iners]|uniref:hypothetical protein n=1 Tax=Lactobacillus iners TaxID=147802 RepID=UPI0001E5DBAB|nr:hypothetical protein HMPREF9212_0219 [Lactobacillus iners LactinV 03V1-b]MCT7690311.1 hypothetical protein [Lactobacillus crispatus]MCT7739176.1 hypothetical protein [Lactobacillus iners]
MKNKFSLYFLKTKNLTDEYKPFFKAGLAFYFGIAFIIFGIGLILQNKTSPTFAANTEKPAVALKAIKSDINKNRAFTVVIHKQGCRDCERVEKSFVHQYLKTKKESKTDYIMFDISKMTNKQQQELIQLLPQITVAGNRILTPTIAYFKGENRRAVLIDISQNPTAKSLNNVLVHSKDGGVNKK